MKISWIIIGVLLLIIVAFHIDNRREKEKLNDELIDAYVEGLVHGSSEAVDIALRTKHFRERGESYGYVYALDSAFKENIMRYEFKIKTNQPKLIK